MLHVRSLEEVENARRAIARIGKLSDNIVGIGPFGIGIDGILAWIPGLGDLYSLAAGGMLLLLGVRTRAPLTSLIQVGVIVGARTTIGAAAIPLLGPLYPLSGAVVDLFRGHKMSADLLIKAMDKTLYVEGHRNELQSNPALADQVATARAQGLRIVHLG
jgi:hypothetical protein